jgi:hypothetical protein
MPFLPGGTSIGIAKLAVPVLDDVVTLMPVISVGIGMELELGSSARTFVDKIRIERLKTARKDIKDFALILPPETFIALYSKNKYPLRQLFSDFYSSGS